MPEGNQAPTGQNTSQADPQTGQNQAGNDQPQQTFDRAYVEQLRQEAAGYRTKAQALEAAQRQREEADLSEAEKAKKRAAELQTERDQARAELHQSRLERAVTRVASRLNFADPDDALALLDRAALDIDEATGQPDPDKVEKALAALLKRKPYLATTTPPPRGGAGAPTNGAGGANAAGTFTKTQIADRAFYLAHKDAIMAAMREGRIIDE